MPFLAGFAVLCGVLLGTSAVDATGYTAIDTFKLVVIPAAALPTFSLLIVSMSLTVPLLALAVPRRALMPTTGGASWNRP